MSNFSIVIITQNEESNIRQCLEPCVRFCDDVWVIDSYSTDNTTQIAEILGAKVVKNVFESWGQQRNYALDHLDLKHDTILFLDADEEINENFCKELVSEIDTGLYCAFYVNFDIVFLGKVLKHAHENPPILRVIKKGTGRWLSQGARENCVFKGESGRIKTRIRHEDRKGLFFWLAKHISNADRESKVILAGPQVVKPTAKEEQRMERSSRAIYRQIYNRVPPAIRSTLLFLYRYILRLGFLDGYPGFVFCFLQAYWYNLIIDARVYESKLGHDHYLPVYGGKKA